MCRADSLESLGQSPATSPYTLVASTTFSRRPPPLANHRPRICSVSPAAVAVGRVEEVDSFLERPIHDGEAVGLFGLRAEVHRAETQRADEEPRSSEMSVVHGSDFRRFPSGSAALVLSDSAPRRSWSRRRHTRFFTRRTPGNASDSLGEVPVGTGVRPLSVGMLSGPSVPPSRGRFAFHPAPPTDSFTPVGHTPRSDQYAITADADSHVDVRSTRRLPNPDIRSHPDEETNKSRFVVHTLRAIVAASSGSRNSSSQ